MPHGQGGYSRILSLSNAMAEAAEAEDWVLLTELASDQTSLLRSLPRASTTDRTILEESLRSLATALEKAETHRNQIADLLCPFDRNISRG